MISSGENKDSPSLPYLTCLIGPSFRWNIPSLPEKKVNPTGAATAKEALLSLHNPRLCLLIETLWLQRCVVIKAHSGARNFAVGVLSMYSMYEEILAKTRLNSGISGTYVPGKDGPVDTQILGSPSTKQGNPHFPCLSFLSDKTCGLHSYIPRLQTASRVHTIATNSGWGLNEFCYVHEVPLPP